MLKRLIFSSLLFLQLFAQGEMPLFTDLTSANFISTKTIPLSGKLINPIHFVSDGKYFYILDNFNNTINKYDLDGELLDSINSLNGNYLQPNGIAQDEECLYITDASTKTIIKLNKYDFKNSSIITINNINTNFIEPYGIYVSKYKDILLTDTVMNEFLRINIFGNVELRKGYYGAVDRTLIEPIDICIDNNQNIYVADQGDHSVKIFDQNGLYQTTLMGFTEIGGLDYNRGLLFVSDTGAKNIKIYRKSVYLYEINTNNPADICSVGNKLFILDPVMKQVIVYEQKNP